MGKIDNLVFDLYRYFFQRESIVDVSEHKKGQKIFFLILFQFHPDSKSLLQYLVDA